MGHWDQLQANVLERDEAAGALIGQFYCTSGAIQKGVPTEVFLLRRVFVSWAETPAGKSIHALDSLPSLSLDMCFFLSQRSDWLVKAMMCEKGNSEQ